METSTQAQPGGSTTGGRPSRPYDGTLRRRRAAETRERILDAGSELIHRTSVRDWKKLTVRAVAERAGVNERTVYRYFGSERGLRDAMLHRNEQEAGIELEGMRLEDVATVAAQIFDHVAQYPREPRPPLDPTLMAAKDRQHQALLDAVATEVGRAPDPQQVTVAALLDALWSVASYERLVDGWSIDHVQAVNGIAWVIGLVEAAVRAGDGPAA
jgi:AcrR family transcriptional regulator